MRGRPLGAIFLGLPSRISMDDSPGNPRISMDDSPGIPREILGFSWIFPQIPWIFHQIPWEILGFPWIFHQIPWEILGFSWMVHQNSLGNPRIFMDFSPNSLGNPRISMDFSPNSLGNPRISMDFSPSPNSLGNPRIFMDFSPNSLGNPRIFMDFSPNSLNPADGSTSFLVCCKMQGPLRQSPFLGLNTYDAYGFVRLVPHISFETTRGGTWGFGHSPFEQRPARSHIAGGGGRYRYR